MFFAIGYGHGKWLKMGYVSVGINYAVYGNIDKKTF